jgi:23S rRNA pseudouridine1911/1915/1917 synthase
VGESEAGQRLDLAVAALAGVPRAQARRWIEGGRVGRNGEPAPRASQRLHEGDVLEVEPPEPIPSPLTPEPIPLAVLHEDADLIVIDKPAGLVVHPAPGNPTGTLVNALLHHCGDLAGIGGVLRPGIVHRLDRGTSGVMVVAKHDAAHLALAEQFRVHSVERVYLALVRGLPRAEEGAVERPIGRHPRERKRMSVHSPAGREARTRWRVRERFPAEGVSLLEVRPETGRTHQIRVHLASAGLPIVGDPVYGRGRSRLGLERPALHAAVLGFVHPRSGERLRFTAPCPSDLAGIAEALRRREARA